MAGLTFDAWYRDEHPKVLAAILVRAEDRGLAEEVVAEAFVRALERWPRVRAMRSPGAWTYRVAGNLLKRRLRRRGLERRLLGAAAAADPTPWATAPECPAVAAPEAVSDQDPGLWQAVWQLPPRQREAVALRYVADLSETEVAARMGVAPGTVAATLNAARSRLAGSLAPPAGREPGDG